MYRGSCALLSVLLVSSLLFSSSLIKAVPDHPGPPPGPAPGLGEDTIKFGLVQSWAEKLGFELWHFGDLITRRKEAQESFKTAQIEPRDGSKIVSQMAQDIEGMMELKKSAVRRIVDAAENSALSLQRSPHQLQDFIYYNSKRIESPTEPAKQEALVEDESEPPPLREITLTPNPHFWNKSVNTSFSSVHLPTNVYDRAPDVIDGIKWSENLDSIFTNNYQMDPSLSWQYFGSSTGFMRHFPAMQWKYDPVDLYDCRLRSWYIEAATSAKDVVILVDGSGSMTGQRREIARHVVSNILDTLGNNDFVNIFSFNDTIYNVVPCFNNTLIQANLGNIRELKLGMENVETVGIANFSAALIKAFELLESYRTEREGAECNQAIMLISDGVPYNYQEIFQMYNWKERPKMPVRVFTYLIGREVADVREIKWMACANQGYYVHLSTLAEVREQVLNYIPVMARPLVLWGTRNPAIWTSVYADYTDPKMTDYLWEKYECEEQKDRFKSHRKNSALFRSKEEQDRRNYWKRKQKSDPRAEIDGYRLMTSVSMPAYDLRQNANITEDVLVNEAYWVTITRETRIANLLGVAGTDVPIKDIQALMMPHQLGVNGYAFIVTNNGYILTHPDLRPVFQGILKPSYNSVDMVEVELLEDGSEPRDFNTELLEFRSSVINQKTGSKWMQVKYHYDDMKRVSRIRRQYFWTKISNSPFSLVVALPEPYGLHRLTLNPEDDIHRTHVKGYNAAHYFRGRRWRIHPDWIYCKHNEKTFESPEAGLLYFLERMKQGWRWPLKPTPPEFMNCDRGLMQAVVFDARVTEWFTQNITNPKEGKGKEFMQRFGKTVAFIATHSGLTRWQTFPPSSPNNVDDSIQFGDVYPRSLDEVWYKRAVEQHFIEPSSFVFSVDFDSGDDILHNNLGENGNGPLVTATHAVFHSVEKTSAPAAVIGFQFQLSNLHTLFTNITFSCGESVTCLKTCKSDDWACYVVDNNGFIVVSEEPTEAGKFFGEIRPPIMNRLIEDNIFKKIQIIDYQAVCFQNRDSANQASFLLTPFKYLQRVLSGLLGYLFWVWQHTSIWGTDAYSYAYSNEDEFVSPTAYQNYESEIDSIGEGDGGSKIPPSKAKERDFDKLVLINRTRPTPCDQEVWLYQLYAHDTKGNSPYVKQANGCQRGFVVQPIPRTNLILVVVDTVCPQYELYPPFKPTPSPVPADSSLACEKAYRMQLPRRSLGTCVKHHPNESEIELCGRATHFGPNVYLTFAVILSTLISLISKIVT